MYVRGILVLLQVKPLISGPESELAADAKATCTSVHSCKVSHPWFSNRFTSDIDVLAYRRYWVKSENSQPVPFRELELSLPPYSSTLQLKIASDLPPHSCFI
jgi:hypothetical protein